MKKIIRFLVRKLPRPMLIRISLILRKPVSWFYKGDAVDCPVCEKSFRKFLPYGNLGIDNRLCPYCLTLERHRLLWLYLKNKTGFFTEKLKVLHIAPEQPFIKHFRKLDNLDYTTADLVSPLADVKTDIRKMVFSDNEFDVVICNHVLEHIVEEQVALKEVLRVLVPGGWAVLQVPMDYSNEFTYEDNTITNQKEREKIFGQYDHVRLYGNDYPKRLENAGFIVKTDDFVNEFDKHVAERFRFDMNEKIFLCRKPV